MPARHMADRIGHGQHGQAEGERDAEKADPEIGKPGGEHGSAAPAEHQPERSEELGGNSPPHVYVHRSLPALAYRDG